MVRYSNIAGTNVRSEGCRECSLEKRTKYTSIQKKEWTRWNNMIRRCSVPSTTGYDRYGGRDIVVSQEFKEYLVWFNYISKLDNAFIIGYSIDRVDNNKGYCRGNLRWATQSQQNYNKNKKTLTYKNKEMSYAEFINNHSRYSRSITYKKLKEGSKPEDLAKGV